MSFVDVLNGTATAQAFRGRIVVIGDMTTTKDDSYTSADRSARMPAAELQANAIATIVAGLPLSNAPGALTVAMIVALALLATALAIYFSTPAALALSAAAGLLVVLAAQLSFGAGTVIAIVAPLLTLVVATVANPIATRAARIGGPAEATGPVSASRSAC